jgi:large subunit ribosomal protein L4
MPRDYTQRVNKKMKAAALRGALSDRARNGLVHVVETFVDGDTPRTKDALAVLNSVTDVRRVLVVLAYDDQTNWVSLRNLQQVHLLDAGQLNTYDVLVADAVVFTAAALDEFLGVPAAPDDDTDEDAELAADAEDTPSTTDIAYAVDAELVDSEADESDEAENSDEEVQK